MVSPSLSVIVPLHNEAENVEALVAAVDTALRDAGGWELILVDDGSTDRTASLAGAAARRDPGRVRLIQLARNYGQTAALAAGLDEARGHVLVAMDGDLQNDPRDIPTLVAKLEEGYDVVAGYRAPRQDPLLTRRVPSWIANRLIRVLTGVPIRDTGCSLKAFRREVVERLRLYSDMHRFLPAIAAGTAGARIAEIPVRHHPRRHGTSKYGLARIFAVAGDLLVITTIRSLRERPLYVFSALAVAALGLAGAVAAAAALAYLGPPFSRPTLVLPTAASMLVGLSVHLVLVGILAEVAVRKHHLRFGAPTPVSRQEEAP